MSDVHAHRSYHYKKKRRLNLRFKCFHNGKILIVICFKLYCKYTIFYNTEKFYIKLFIYLRVKLEHILHSPKKIFYQA